MSLLAYDVGNCNILAAVPRGKGIDIVTSDTSSKQIPSVVSYQSERRYFAEQANQQKVSNRNACFYYLPLIIAEQFDSPAIKRANDIGIQYQLKAGSDGRAVASVYFGGENIILETEQINAALINKIKHFAEQMDNVTPSDVILTVPNHWSAHKKASMRAAVESTGLKSLGIISQHMSVGVGYYMRRINDFQQLDKDNKGIQLAVLSIGEVESFFSIMQMNKFGVTTVRATHSQNVGSIDFDRCLATLIERLAIQSKKITLDELKQKKTQVKIMKAANQVKKVLSINAKAPATLECVGDNQIDIQVLINGEDFEKIIAELKLTDVIEQLIKQGLQDIDIKDIEAIELVGGASRVRSINQLVSKIFGEAKITRRINPDEAAGFGLGWIGAIRSSKYKVPFEVGISDLIQNLKNPLSLVVYDESNKLVFEKPLELFKNGESFPKSKKVTLRFAPGKYRACLIDGDEVHEEQTFEVKPKNFNQFVDKEAAITAGVDFQDQNVKCVVKVIADNDGYFKINSIVRSQHELVHDDVKKKVPNPKFEEDNNKRTEEIAKRELEFTTKSTEYETKQKEYEEILKQDKVEEETFKKDNPDKTYSAPKRDAPEKPIKPLNPPEINKEMEITEKVPRIALMSTDVGLQFVAGLHDVSAKAQQLREFEMKCQNVDQQSLLFDAAINDIESVIYNTRDGLDFALKQHVKEDEAQQISKILDEYHEYAQNVEGKHQINELKQKTDELKQKLKIYYDRKQSFQDLEVKQHKNKLELEQLKSKYQCDENQENITAINEKITSYNQIIDGLVRTEVAPDVFADLGKFITDIENKLKEGIKKRDDAIKKIEEEKKKQQEDKKKAETPKEESKPEQDKSEAQSNATPK